ncbi:MAG: glycosyltransferase [Dermatophilaceae bacterium]
MSVHRAFTDRASVSVVIPTYNYGRFLEGCVESVVAQEGVNAQVLVIDDQSTDNSKEVGEALASKHENVTMISHRVNRGRIATYNEGLFEWADGKYSLLLSADDRLTKGALARAVDIMEDHPKVGLVYGRCALFSTAEDNVPWTDRRVRPPRVWEGREWLAKRYMDGMNNVITPTVIVRTETQRRVGPYNAALPHAADFEMWLRFAAVSDVGFVRAAQALYRIHSSSMSQHVNLDPLADARERKQVFETIAEQYGFALSAAGTSIEDAYRAIASERLWQLCRMYEKGKVHEIVEAEWVDFAKSTFPAAPSLHAFRAYERRRRMGVPLCRTQVFFGTHVARRLRRKWSLDR